VIRRAAARDLDALVDLENESFRGDRLSRRSLARAVAGDRSLVLVDADRAFVRGYALVSFREGSAVARLYSIAVDRRARGRGVGRGLLDAAERAAARGGRSVMRLEVRKDNRPSLGLFRDAGYAEFARTVGYYEDGMTALRFEKALRGATARPAPRRAARAARGGRSRRGKAAQHG